MKRSSLVDEFTKIANILKDTKGDWKKRQEALQKCHELLNSDFSDEPYFAETLEMIANGIGEQFGDLRSSIVKEAAQFIRDSAELLGESIAEFGEKVLLGETLLKQINSGNKIVSEMAHEQAVKSLLSNAVCSRSIPLIVGELKSKNAQVRSRVTEYISIILENYPEDVVERSLDGFKKAIKKSLADADPKARDHARSALNSLQERFPTEAKKLMSSLDSSVMRQINIADPGQTADLNTMKLSRPTKVVKRSITSAKSTKTKDDSRKNTEPDDNSKKESSRPRSIQKRGDPSSIGKPKRPSNSKLRRTENSQATTAKTSISTKKKPPTSHGRANRSTYSRSSKARNDHSSEDEKPADDEVPVAEIIEGLFEKLDNKNWSERTYSLNQISDTLQSENKEPASDALIKRIFLRVLKLLDDIHVKVQVASLKLISNNFDLFSQHVLKKKTKIITKIVLFMTESKEQIRTLGNTLLKQFARENTEREMMELVIKVIHTFPNVKAQFKALELLDQILFSISSSDYTSCLARLLISKVAFIFTERQKDKDFTTLCLSLFSKSLSKAPSPTREHFSLLSPTVQNSVIEMDEKCGGSLSRALEGKEEHHTLGVQDHYDDEEMIEEHYEDQDDQDDQEGFEQDIITSTNGEKDEWDAQEGYHYESESEEGDGARAGRTRKREAFSNSIANKKTIGKTTALSDKNSKPVYQRRSSDHFQQQEIKTEPSVKKTRKIDLNVDLIDPEDIENIAKTLELLHKKLAQLKSQAKMSDLKNLLNMAFPYMVKILSLQVEEVHTFCFDLIESTYSYFNLCNDAYTLLLNNLLGLFDSHPAELDLLHEVADLVIMFPFRAELMKHMLIKFEKSNSPSLQLIMKLMVSLLAAANSSEININDFRKGFMTSLGKLIYYLTKHINHEHPEVRKGVVFVLVELHFFLGEDEFMNIMDNFNHSQQKLVSIYIKKKLTKN